MSQRKGFLRVEDMNLGKAAWSVHSSPYLSVLPHRCVKMSIWLLEWNLRNDYYTFLRIHVWTPSFLVRNEGPVQCKARWWYPCGAAALA